jgi:cysteine desulfurase
MSTVIYLDNHASTQIDPMVLETMMPYLTTVYGNASSTHAYGIKAEQAVEKARRGAAAIINARPQEIFFTAGATESNNLVIKGVFDHFRDKKPHMITTLVEHKCILEACNYVRERGAELTLLPVDKNGLVSPQAVASAIKANTVLVSVMHGNNEIGSINPIGEIGAACHEKGVLFHTDAAQALGKIPIDVEAMGIDLLSASAHKIYGPKGVGMVFVRKSAKSQITPLLQGGGQESGIRSGTLNVPGIAGFGRALEIAAGSMTDDHIHASLHRDRLYYGLNERLNNIHLNGPAISEPTRLPNNLNILLLDVEVSALKRSVRSVSFSSGSACSSANQKPSYVLTAIGRSEAEAHSSLRFGVGRFTTGRDIDTAVRVIVEEVGRLNPGTLRHLAGGSAMSGLASKS